eukprot:scaffold231092_cov17-Tisochrysis_lutea.AAC.2
MTPPLPTPPGAANATAVAPAVVAAACLPAWVPVGPPAALGAAGVRLAANSARSAACSSAWPRMRKCSTAKQMRV